MKTDLKVNNSKMSLSDIRIDQLNALLLSPNHKWAACVSMTTRAALDAAICGENSCAYSGFLEGFNCDKFEMLRGAFLLDDLAYRDEIREYGLTIVKSIREPLTKKEELVAQWLFSSKTPALIGGIIGCAKSTVDFHMLNIAKKILASCNEQSRFNICAGLLTIGYPKGFSATSTDFLAYEKSITQNMSA